MSTSVSTVPVGRATALTVSEAALPSFIVIGAMRAATTTLHRHLAAHPGIGMSRGKETDYFVAERTFGRELDSAHAAAANGFRVSVWLSTSSVTVSCPASLRR